MSKIDFILEISGENSFASRCSTVLSAVKSTFLVRSWAATLSFLVFLLDISCVFAEVLSQTYETAFRGGPSLFEDLELLQALKYCVYLDSETLTQRAF